MTTTHPDPRAAAWLDRVERLAATLPDTQRSELLIDLREHIDAALAGGTPDVHAVLDRLGDPADVVAAAAGEGASAPIATAPPPAPTSDVPGPGTTTAERLTLAGLLLSGVIALLWPVAMVVWTAATVGLLVATRWRGAEIAVALSLPLLLAAITIVPAGLLVVVARTCEQVEGGVETCTGGSSGGLGQLAAVAVLVLALATVVFAVRWLVRRVDGRPAR